jgi:predicted aconitase with swiveling domain
MKKEFKGRNVVAGSVQAQTVVSRKGMNTLATFQKSILAKKKSVFGSDQNNEDLYKKEITGKALCLPKTIGSTTGGMVLQSAAALGLAPKAMLFSESIDSIGAAGVILADVWTVHKIVTVDNLGQDFLDYVKDGMTITVNEDGTVVVQ